MHGGQESHRNFDSRPHVYVDWGQYACLEHVNLTRLLYHGLRITITCEITTATTEFGRTGQR